MATSAGRGFLYITFAKGWFMVAGFATQSALTRLLEKSVWGEYSLVTKTVSLINNVIVAATIATIARMVVQNEAHHGVVTRTALVAQGVVGAALVALLALLAFPFGHFLADQHLVPYLQLTLGVTLCYSLYTVFIGTANGRREFNKQAGLDITFSTLKTTLVLGGAALGLGLRGALGGFVAAALVITVIAALWIGPGPKPPADVRLPLGRLYSFLGLMIVYVLLQNAVLVLDIWLLKKLVGEAALASGTAVEAARTHANEVVGIYSAVQNLSFLPFQGVLAITFVIFPLVSKSTFEGDASKTRAYVASTLRYTLLLAAAIAVPFFANPGGSLRLVSGAGYEEGAVALRVLSLGGIGIGILAVMGSILNGSSRSGSAIAMVSCTCFVVVVIAFLTVGRAANPALAAAIATSSGVTAGIAVGGIRMRSTLGAFLPPLSVLRVTAAIAAAGLVGHYLPAGGKVLTLVDCGVAEAIFLAVLVTTRELSLAELRQARAIARSGAGVAQAEAT